MDEIESKFQDDEANSSYILHTVQEFLTQTTTGLILLLAFLHGFINASIISRTS